MTATMRPFKALLSKDEALARILEASRPTERKERVPIERAAHRVVATRVTAPLDVPAFTRSAMDGYAVRAEDTFGASRTARKRLAVVGTLHAGETTKRALAKGEAIQIATGAKLPPGADAVVRVESTDREGANVIVSEAVPPGANVSKQGSDIAKGHVVFTPGTVLNPARVGLAASLGVAEVEVFARPRVAVIPTGNEIAKPGEPLREGQVYNSNAYALEAILAENGADVARSEIIEDSLASLRDAFDGSKNTDVLVFSGGSSVGERDLLVDVIREKGEVLVHGVQVKPGKPLLVGRLKDGRVVLGLPGYPVSCVTNAYVFVVPAVRRIAHLPARIERRVALPMSEKIVSNLGRYQFLPVAIRDGKVYSVFKESGALTSLTEADGYVGIPDNVDLVEAGDVVEMTFW